MSLPAAAYPTTATPPLGSDPPKTQGQTLQRPLQRPLQRSRMCFILLHLLLAPRHFVRDLQNGEVQLDGRLSRGGREIVADERGQLVPRLRELGRLFDRSVLQRLQRLHLAHHRANLRIGLDNRQRRAHCAFALEDCREHVQAALSEHLGQHTRFRTDVCGQKF